MVPADFDPSLMLKPFVFLVFIRIDDSIKISMFEQNHEVLHLVFYFYILLVAYWSSILDPSVITSRLLYPKMREINAITKQFNTRKPKFLVKSIRRSGLFDTDAFHVTPPSDV